MNADTRVIQIAAKGTNYINIGCPIQDEMCFFEIDFIVNAHNWGVTVVDPDGKSTTRLAPYGDDIFDIKIVYGEIEISLAILYSEKYDMYEVFLQ